MDGSFFLRDTSKGRCVDFRLNGWRVHGTVHAFVVDDAGGPLWVVGVHFM